MNYTVELAASFQKAYKKLRKKYSSLEKDVDNLVAMIKSNPAIGADLGDGVRKIRMAVSDKGKGKSGGARYNLYGGDRRGKRKGYFVDDLRQERP